MSNESQVLRVIAGGSDKRPTAEVAVVYDDGSPAYPLLSDGAPADAVQATLSRNPAGDDNGLTFTAVEYGAAGNDISIAYIDPEANDSPLSVSVNNKAITVSLETDGSGDIASTAAEVLAAIEASDAADSLVSVVIDTGDTGSGDDGSGVVTALAAANMTGGAGFGVGVVGKGGLAIDTTNAKLYINGGTKAAPDWNIVTSA